MFVPSMMRKGPGLRGQGSNGQPVYEPLSKVCQCGCHHGEPPGTYPPAVEARLCRECADERFAAWQDLIEVMMRG